MECKHNFVKAYKAIAVKTCYWKPGENYIKQITSSINGKIKDGDIITISEKAISTSTGNILDESTSRSGLTACLIAKYWMRHVWGYVLGFLCHLKKETIKHCRNYPIEEGSKHKQIALQYAGFLQALMHGSEGAIDGSNLPYSYVSLPLKNAQAIAQKIQEQIKAELNKNVTVIIVDTDKTFTFRNFHFTPRPNSIPRIQAGSNFVGYLFGRLFKLKRRSTPIAVAGSSNMSVEEALEVSEKANKVRGFGAGKTVWEMTETFSVSLTDMTWSMLEKVEHKPIVIVRQRRPKRHLKRLI
jgi:F420-0:gamma-glutamyl ligase-like protein